MFTSTRVAFAAARKAAPKAARKPMKLSSYGLFMKQNAKAPAFSVMTISQRGRAMGKMWRALPARFVKKNYAKVKNLAPKKRLVAIAKMWKQAQKK